MRKIGVQSYYTLILEGWEKRGMMVVVPDSLSVKWIVVTNFKEN